MEPVADCGMDSEPSFGTNTTEQVSRSVNRIWSNWKERSHNEQELTELQPDSEIISAQNAWEELRQSRGDAQVIRRSNSLEVSSVVLTGGCCILFVGWVHCVCMTTIMTR